MTTVAALAADKAARAEITHSAAQKMKTLWPTRIQPWPKCRGTEGECNSGQPPGRDGFCSVCHKRVVTLIVRGYDVHPLAVLRVSYATYRAKTPQSAPKPNRKPMAARVFTEGDTGGFPTPEQARAKVPAPVPPADPVPMFGQKWAAPAEKPEPAPTMRDLLNLVHAPDPVAPASEPSTSPNLTDARATIDALRGDLAQLRANLRNPNFLRHALDHIEAKAAEIAALKARLAELENE